MSLLLLCSGLGVAATSGHLPSNCVQSGSTVSCSFGYAGGEQNLPVPIGVSRVHVRAVGASVFPSAGASTATAAIASATVPVKPGSTLYVEVGGPGQPCGATSTGTTDSGGAGGWNGGGEGGHGTGSCNGTGGSGASDVRTVSCATSLVCNVQPGYCGSTCSAQATASLQSRLVVAGGSGGDGTFGGSSTPCYGPFVGQPCPPATDPGGRGGSAGSPGGNSADGNTGGGGGTTASGGAAGSGNGANGQPGALGFGGAGGSGGGGGGGGGYYGGGGGSGGANGATGNSSSGGGGGGSSYAPGETISSAPAGTAPSITISYQLPPAAHKRQTHRHHRRHRKHKRHRRHKRHGVVPCCKH